MSKKAEIVEEMKKRSLIAIHREDYEMIATEIEKLYEGKVVYVAQHLIGGLWHDAYIRLTFDELTEILKGDLSLYNEKGKRQLLKRTTIDQIIED